MVGQRVVFVDLGCWGYAPRRRLEGVVLESHIDRFGEHWVRVQSDGLKGPRWLHRSYVQVITAASAEADSDRAT